MQSKKISYAQNGEDILLDRCFGEIEKGFYVDVGAAHPTKNSVTKFFYEKGWKGINVEPVPNFFNVLEEERPNDINLNIAASDQDGSKTFYMVARGSLSTFNGEYAEQIGRERSVKVEPIEIPTRTLDSICTEFVKGKPIQFLKIDAEGWERQVLLGADFIKFRPRVIVIEATKPNTTEVCSDDWDSLILNSDYLEAYFDGINKFYVAKEAGDLVECFHLPPNWQDGFTSYERHIAETSLRRLSRNLGELSETLLNPLAELIQSEGNASVSRLAGAISHLAQRLESQTDVLRDQAQKAEDLRVENLSLQNNIATLSSELAHYRANESYPDQISDQISRLIQSELDVLRTEFLTRNNEYRTQHEELSRNLDQKIFNAEAWAIESSTMRSENDALKKNIGLLSEEIAAYRANQRASKNQISQLEASNKTLSELMRISTSTSAVPDPISTTNALTSALVTTQAQAQPFVAAAPRDEKTRRVLLVCRAGDELINKGRARSIWAANIASALAELGLSCTLSGRCSTPPLKLEHPQGLEAVKRQLASTYGVQETFDLEITSPPRKVKDQIGEWEASNYYPEHIDKYDFVYCRDPRIAELCAKMEVAFVYEDHNEDYHLGAGESLLHALNSEHCKVVVAITDAVKKRLFDGGINGHKVLVVDSGVNAQSFDDLSEAAIRWRQFLLKQTYQHLIVYTGGLQKERGVDQILDAAALMQDCLFFVAGGRKADQNALREAASSLSLTNIMIPGYLPRQVVNEIQQAADALLLTREDSERKMITSPLKLFEYLASRRPVVSYPLPTVAVDTRAALPVFEYHPLNGIELSRSIRRLLQDNPFTTEHYENGLAFSRTREWRQRQEDILKSGGLL